MYVLFTFDIYFSSISSFLFTLPSSNLYFLTLGNSIYLYIYNLYIYINVYIYPRHLTNFYFAKFYYPVLLQIQFIILFNSWLIPTVRGAKRINAANTTRLRRITKIAKCRILYTFVIAVRIVAVIAVVATLGCDAHALGGAKAIGLVIGRWSAEYEFGIGASACVLAVAIAWLSIVGVAEDYVQVGLFVGSCK